MLRSGVDRAFARWVRTGDPVALGRVFDRAAPELYRLAWHLLADRHAAEDCVQQAFVVAIEQRSGFDAQRRVLPWLCGILTNRALHARRQARRRDAGVAHAAAAAGELADPLDAASAREAQEVVAARVRALPEPYRQVLLLHLVHELSGKEIAEALARPDATVRSQLARGLELLRRALPVGIGGFAAGQVPPPLGLAAVRDAVLAHAEAAGAVTVASVGATPVAGGAAFVFSGVLAMKKVLLGAVLLAAVLCAWPLWTGEPAAPRLPGDGAGAQPAAPIEARAPAAVPDATPAAGGERLAVAPSRDPNVAALEVLVRWHDGAPARGVIVRCRPRPLDVETWLFVATTGDDGVARFEALPPGAANALTNRGVAADVELAAGALARAEIDLPAGTDVNGRVVDLDGRGFPGATVWMSVAPNSDDGEPVATSGPDGTFAVRAATRQQVLIATAPGFATAKDCKVGAREIVLTMRPAPGTVVGTVVDPDGRPVAGARVLLGLTMTSWSSGRHESFLRVGEITGADLWPARFVRTDDEGRFRCEGLPPWRWPLWAGAAGFAPHRSEVDVRATGETEVVARLTVGATVRGRVTDDTGVAIAGTTVYAHLVLPPLDARLSLGVDNASLPPLWARTFVVTDANGGYELARVMPGKYLLRVHHARKTASAEHELADGATFVWDAVIAPRDGERGTRLTGTLVDENGTPLDSWEIRIGERGNAHNPTWLWVGESGQLRTNPVPDGRHRILAQPRGEQLAEPVDLGEHSAADCPLRLVVPAANLPKARLRGRVVRPASAAAAQCDVEVTLLDANRSVRLKCDALGDWSAGPLGRGRYRVRIESDAFGAQTIGPFDVTGTDDVDTGTCSMPEPRVLVVTAVDERGTRRPDAWFHARPLGDDRRSGSLQVRDGVGRGHLPPGRWRVTTWGDTPFACADTEVRAGQTTELRLTVPDGVPFVLRVPPLPARRRFETRWLRPDGELLRAQTVYEDENGRDLPFAAPAGVYTLEVTDPSGAQARASVQLAEPGQVVALPLPAAPAAPAATTGR
jgi:RNA polymerase sigma-70 factor (ECF subfamily)